MTGDKTGHCTILACQIDVPQTRSRSDVHAHVGNTVQKLEIQLDERSADLVVLPELSMVEYSRESFDVLSDTAESIDGHIVQTMQEVARKHSIHIVFGMPLIEQGNFYISQIVIGSGGELIGRYNKLHVCQYGASMEKEYFERGDNVCVFDLNGIRFAPIICYDIRIPELCRALTIEQGVQCILHCGAYFRDESFMTWHAFATTRAMENQIYFVSLNRAGKDYGNSLFCPPWMDSDHMPENFNEYDEDYRFLEVNVSKLGQVRADYTFLEDRLEDYSELTR